MREPDALDSARVLALALLAVAGAWLLFRAGLPVVAGAFQQAAFLATPLLYARGAGLRPFGANGYVALRLRQGGLVLVASLGTLWLLYGLTHLQTTVIEKAGYKKEAEAEERHIREGIERAQEQGAVPALSLLVLVPPFCEETFFRGILFRGLLNRFGLGVALGVSSVLFAYFPQTIVQTVLMVFLGCYFGMLVYLTGSLWSSILAHAVNNLVVLVLMWRYKGDLPEFRAPWWMYALSAVVFGLAMTGLALDRKSRAAKE
ncbi:MAG TPA: CPBP family intramembrane glutamic endopeptidase [Planctomycetota bacterium]|nr:CPBP family intramembrane glutamic endopeptidase [Planctomycetota bacterium]